jgi:hypothetical protein
MSKSYTVGKHHISEVDDLVTVIWHGPASLAEIREIMGHVDQIYRQHGYALLLFDVTEAELAEEGSRKWLAAWARDNPQCRVATFGASLIIRTTLLLLNRASRISETQFCASEAEARAWLSDQREPLRRAAAPRPQSA